MKRLGLVPVALALISLAVAAAPVQASSEPLLVNVYGCDLDGHAATMTHKKDWYINYGWQAKTKNQLLKYLASATTIVKVDGVKIADADFYWSAPYKNQSHIWTVAWLYPTDQLAIGESIVVTLQTRFSTQIYDGTDHYGPGREFHPAVSCTITGS